MNNIIQRAKKLFYNRYHDEPWLAMVGDPAKGYWVETDNSAEVALDFVSESDTLLAAAAPDFAQALSEETYEYAAQVKRGDDWETSTNSETHLEEWWADKDDAEWAAGRLQEQDHETRLVRRRVSPPEVIEDA